MAYLWVLVEWMDTSPAAVDVVCIPMRQGNVQIATNQIILVKSKRGLETRMAQVLETSTNKEHLLRRKMQIDANQDGFHHLVRASWHVLREIYMQQIELDSTPHPRPQNPMQQVEIDDEENELEEENIEDIYGPNARPSTSGLARGAQSNERSDVFVVPQSIEVESSNNVSVEIQQSIRDRPIMRAVRRAETSGHSPLNTAQIQDQNDSSRAGPSNMPIRPNPIYGTPFNGIIRLFNPPEERQNSPHRSNRLQPIETHSTHRERSRRPHLNRSLQNIQQQSYLNRSFSDNDEDAHNVSRISHEQAFSYRNLLNLPAEEQMVLGDDSADRNVPDLRQNRLSRPNIHNRSFPVHDENQEYQNVPQSNEVVVNRDSGNTDNELTQQNRSRVSQTHQVLIRSSHIIRMDGNQVNVENQVNTRGRSQQNVPSNERFRESSGPINPSPGEQKVPHSSANLDHTPNQGGSGERPATHDSTHNMNQDEEVFIAEMSSDSEVEYYNSRENNERYPAINSNRRELLDHYNSLESLRPERFNNDGSNETDQAHHDDSRRETFQRRTTNRLCPTCGQNLPNDKLNFVNQGPQEHYNEDATDLQNETNEVKLKNSCKFKFN